MIAERRVRLIEGTVERTTDDGEQEIQANRWQ